MQEKKLTALSLWLAIAIMIGVRTANSSSLATVFIKEETRINQVVTSFANLSLRVALPVRADSISNDFDKQYGVRADGSIFVSSRIDLDEITSCPEPVNDSVCCKSYTVMVGDASQWPKFRICLVDVNEHVPTFFEGASTVNISALTIEQPEDEKNQKLIIRLSLRDIDFTTKKSRFFTFFLANNTDDDTRRLFGSYLSSTKPTNITVGPDNVVLKLARSLDREQRAVYNFTLLACEPLNLSRCGHLDVTLRVSDENDNEPQFTQSEYTFNVSESAVTLHDYAVGHVRATDADFPENGNTQYEMGEAHCDDPNSEGVDVASLFQVDQNGRVSLSSYANNELLDYELCKRVSFLVRAWDGNRAESRSEDRSTTRVIVNILNTDDTPPAIKFEMKDLHILENQRNFSNALPVRIIVDDPDSLKANVTCFLVHPVETPFRLQSTASRGTDSQEFVLYATQTLDRENQPEWQITLTCTDAAGNNNQSTLTVSVLDENDNAPEFTSVTDRFGMISSLIGNRSEVHMPENNLPGALVARLTARDADAGENGAIEYAFLLGGVTTNRSGSRFEIDSRSGEILALELFDRELYQQFDLVVAAIDRGHVRRTATASLTVRIDDENDNPPRFTERQYHFRVPEAPFDVTETYAYAYGYSVFIGALNASDRDAAGPLAFTLLNETSRFSVNERGELFAIVPLDRETAARYLLAVQVSDGRFTDTAIVLVELIDLDDSAPEFIFPNRLAHNYTARFECPSDRSKVNQEFFVAQLDAVDRDADPTHSRIAYTLLGSPLPGERSNSGDAVVRGLFRVDEQSGQIWYRRPADCITGTFELVVGAYNPNDLSNVTNRSLPESGRVTESRLLVVVRESPSQSQFSPDSGIVPSRNANSNREFGSERDTTVSGIGMPQLLVALAIGAVVVVIAILVLLVIVARLNHREDDRTGQHGGPERKRQRRKLMHSSNGSLRRGAMNETKPPQGNDEPEADYDAEEEDDDAASSARNVSGCGTPTYSSAQAHARLNAAASHCRRGYMYQPVSVGTNRSYQLATLTHATSKHDMLRADLTGRASCGSVCSACAAATLQRTAVAAADERYHVLMRASGEYETTADDDDDDSNTLAQTSQSPAACTCADCAALQNRTLPLPLPSTRPASKNDYAERDATIRFNDDATRRYATVNATLNRRDQPRAAPVPAPPAERIYVHQTQTPGANRLSNRSTDMLVSTTESEKILDTNRCSNADCENRVCSLTKHDDDAPAPPTKSQTTARQPSEVHCAVSFV